LILCRKINLPVWKFQRFLSGTSVISGGSGLEILELLVRWFRRFWSESSGASGLEVLKLLVRKFRIFWFRSSRAFGPEIPKVPVQKFFIFDFLIPPSRAAQFSYRKSYETAKIPLLKTI